MSESGSDFSKGLREYQKKREAREKVEREEQKALDEKKGKLRQSEFDAVKP